MSVLYELFFRRNIASLASMQPEENSGSEEEEGQAFYAGGSERRYMYDIPRCFFSQKLKFVHWFMSQSKFL